MRRNYQKYNKLNTEKYSKGIKNSLYSLVSIIIGLLFTYLAMTNSGNNVEKVEKNNTSVESATIKTENDIEDYSFVSVSGNSDTKSKFGPPKENKEQDEK